MGFLKRFFQLFSPPSSSNLNALIVKVRCGKCGELIQTRISLSNDLSVEYGELEAETRYTCRKVLIGEGPCYQPVEVTLTFDQNRKVIDRSIRGGTFAEE